MYADLSKREGKESYLRNISIVRVEGDIMKNEKITLSIGILVSNNIKTVEDMFRSLDKIRKMICTEIIVVDTVGEENTDGSLEIAKKYADKLVHFEWCNDFSAARNAGLSVATGEWFMFMDDDEKFIDCEDLISFFITDEYKNYLTATYKIHDYRSKGKYIVANINRMVKREKETKFCGLVHEYLSPMRLPVKELESYIEHHGYEYATEEDRQRKIERNIPLIRKELKNKPNDINLLMLLIQELMQSEKYLDEALKICKETIYNDKNQITIKEPANAFWWIVCSYIRILLKKKDYNELSKKVTEIKKKTVPNELCCLALSVLDVNGKSKNLKADRNDDFIREVCNDLELIEKNYELLISDTEKLFFENVSDLGQFIDKDNIIEAVREGLSVLYSEGKNKEDYFAKGFSFYRKMVNRPFLSVSLLVSNRIGTIEKCMKSLVPLKEELGAEVIAVKTVDECKSDGSGKIAEKYATKTIYFPWCDDFAAARNAGLELATGEWFLYIDDDEWFENVDEIIHFFKSGEYLCYNCANVGIRNYVNVEGTVYSTATVGRMLKLFKDSMFVGRVHESINQLYRPCKMFEVYLHHFGYVYKTEEEKENHIKRNMTLLEKEIKEHPDDIRLHNQLVLEYATYDNEKALICARETIRNTDRQKVNKNVQWEALMIFRLHEALGTPVDEVEDEFLKIKKKITFNEVVENAVMVQMTRICLISGKNIRAYRYAKEYLETYDFLMSHRDIYEDKLIADLARYTDKKTYEEMQGFAGYAAKEAGKLKEAWGIYEKIDWENVNADKMEVLYNVFLLNRKCKNSEVLFSIIKKVMSNSAVKSEFAKLMKGNFFVKNSVESTLESVKRGQIINENGFEYVRGDKKITVGMEINGNRDLLEEKISEIYPIISDCSTELIFAINTELSENEKKQIISKIKDVSSKYGLKEDEEYKIITFGGTKESFKNVCHEKALGEWILMISSDESLKNVKSISKFIKEEEFDYNSAAIQSENKDGVYMGEKIILYRRAKNGFFGPIDEVYSAYNTPIKHIDNTVMVKTESKISDKLACLESILETNMYDVSVREKIVDTLYEKSEYLKAGYDLCIESVNNLCKGEDLAGISYQKLLFDLVKYFVLSGDPIGAEQICTEIRGKFGLLNTVDAAMSYIVAESAHSMNNVIVIINNVDKYMEDYMQVKTYPEDDVINNRYDVLMYLTEGAKEHMLSLGIEASAVIGDEERINRYNGLK